MRIGKITGTIVATIKDPYLLGNTIRIVELIGVDGKSMNDYEVAIDTVGANKNDYVLLVKSSSARMTTKTENRPVDNSIVAIIDIIEMDGKTYYKKSAA